MTTRNTFIADLDRCPECSEDWAYVLDGNRYSYIVAVYDYRVDRTVAWRCPGCARTWPRGSTIGTAYPDRVDEPERPTHHGHPIDHAYWQPSGTPYCQVCNRALSEDEMHALGVLDA